ncbi:MAG: response regulator receiver sensor signal transduction histidine kinase [Bacteroidetes bacterium]|jgi:signal transduction histidine kinase|nr:response regulator receiver sensor signal transduction histidine kinase [Bacteroidota bacterium]
MPPKLLLVDDREDNLMSIEAILGTDGYRFVKANSGRQALKILLSEFDFALILMDVKMPNLNGFETAELIYEREKLKHIPIIFITANNFGEENIYQGYKSGAVDYIYKPINPDLLRAKVSVFVDLYKKNHMLLQQEQSLKSINKSLESEIKERIASEDKVKELNYKLLQNIERLESANKELDRFAFMASHDLQEPLRKIITFSDRLYSKYNTRLDDEADMYINRIQGAAERMRLLIKDILTLSKIMADRDSFVETNLNLVVNEVLSEIDCTIKEKGAKILVEKLPSLHINPGLMRSLFRNLIGNSLKYSKKNVKPIIRISSDISFERTKNERDIREKYCRIHITDNGIGFDQKDSEQIFSIFKRLHFSNEFEGTGIGLAICKKITEQHNGFISARSKIDEGSTFIVSLPVNFPVQTETN